MKEIRADEDAGPHNTKKARPDPETHITEAAKLNHIVLQKIQKAYTINPEDDLLAKFPSGYSTRLARRRKQDEDVKNTLRTDDSTVPVAPNGTSGEMSAMDDKDGGTGGIPLEQGSKADTIAASLGSSSASTAAVVFLLAKVVQRLLRAQTHEMRAESSSLWTKLYETIDAGEVIWQNELSRRVAIVKCDSDIVVRMIPNFEDFTEYTTLQHIRWHAPDIPVPEPLGAMRSEKTAYIFMAFIRGPTLENVWSQLANEQKVSLSNQLSGILIQLRTMQLPKVGLLGGMGDFEDFVFSYPHFGGSVYIKLLRSLSRNQASKVVFSCGDLRPANLVVSTDRQGNYGIAGILDWEMSGFYPDYWESVKATNTMAPQEENDWYLYLSACASPTSYPLHWLMDRKWEVQVA